MAIASAVFAEAGYAGASLNEIARRADLRKASLFHHFPSKEALYREILAELVRDLGRLVEEANLLSGSFFDRLDRLGEMVIDYLGVRRDAARLLLREVIDQGPFMAGQGATIVRSALDLIAAFLQSGMDEGVVADQDPRQLTLSIAGLHLVYFLAYDVSSDFTGKDIFTTAALQERKSEVLGQVRRLCRPPGRV